MRRINFRQGKYIFPAVVFLPLCYIVYYVASLIGGGEETQQVATDRINPDLPEANSRDIGNKLAEMQGRFDDDEAVGMKKTEEKPPCFNLFQGSCDRWFSNKKEEFSNEQKYARFSRAKHIYRGQDPYPCLAVPVHAGGDGQSDENCELQKPQ